MKNLLGGWQISGATLLAHRARRSRSRATNDIAGVGDDAIGQPVEPRRRSDARTPTASSRPAPATDDNFCFNPAAFAQSGGRHVRQLARATSSATPGDQQWDIALFKNFSAAAAQQRLQFRAEMFNFINHPNLNGPNTDITNANFGRVDHQGRQPPRHPARAPVSVLTRISRTDHGSHGTRITRITRRRAGAHPVRRFLCTADLVTAAYDPPRRLPARES